MRNVPTPPISGSSLVGRHVVPKQLEKEGEIQQEREMVRLRERQMGLVSNFFFVFFWSFGKVLREGKREMLRWRSGGKGERRVQGRLRLVGQDERQRGNQRGRIQRGDGHMLFLACLSSEKWIGEERISYNQIPPLIIN